MLLWTDGLDSYSVADDLNSRYVRARNVSLQTGTGRGGGGALRTTLATLGNITTQCFFDLPVVSGATDILHLAAWIKPLAGAVPGTSGGGTNVTSTVVNFVNRGFNSLASFTFLSLSRAQYTNMAGGSLPFEPTTGYLANKGGTWVHLELAWKQHATDGVAKCWMDGNLILNFTGNTSNGNNGVAIDRIALGGNTLDWRELVVWNESGTTGMNVPQLGLHKIETLLPNGPGTYSQLTPSPGGANWENVDEPAFDGEATYNLGNAAGQQDTYNLANLSSVPNQINAVTVNNRAKYQIVPANMKSIIRSGGVDTLGAVTNALRNTYRGFQDIYETNPSGGVEWTKAAIDALEIGARQEA